MKYYSQATITTFLLLKILLELVAFLSTPKAIIIYLNMGNY